MNKSIAFLLALFTCIFSSFAQSSEGVDYVIKKNEKGEPYAFISASNPAESVCFTLKDRTKCTIDAVATIDLDLVEHYYLSIFVHDKRYIASGAKIVIGTYECILHSTFDYTTVEYDYYHTKKYDDYIGDPGEYLFGQRLLFPITLKEWKSIFKNDSVQITISINGENNTYLLSENRTKNYGQLKKLFRRATKIVTSITNSKKKTDYLFKSLCAYQSNSTLPKGKRPATTRKIGFTLCPNGEFYKDVQTGDGVKVFLNNYERSNKKTVLNRLAQLNGYPGILRDYELINNISVMFRTQLQEFSKSPYHIYKGHKLNNEKKEGDFQLGILVTYSDGYLFVKPVFLNARYWEYHGLSGRYGSKTSLPFSYEYYFSTSDFCRDFFFDENGLLYDFRQDHYEDYLQMVEDNTIEFINTILAPSLQAECVIEP